MKELLEESFEVRKEKMFFYSPYTFNREMDKTTTILDMVKDNFVKNYPTDGFHYIDVETATYIFLTQQLAWDTNYFGFPTTKLATILYQDTTYKKLEKAVAYWKESFFNKNTPKYCFIDVPTEDTMVIQALTANGFRMVETRLHYYKNTQEYSDYQAVPVRKATENDIQNLRITAMEARNTYDRLHADCYFDTAMADNYLGTYIENAVKGFAEVVLVPDDKLPADAFLAIGRMKKDEEILATTMARILLTAVLPTRKGWHLKLVAATTHYAKENNIDYVLMTTQATNRAVFRTTEKLGYKLGSTSHILAFQNFDKTYENSF